jgi:polyphosphate kinase 2
MMDHATYSKELRRLHIELVKLQRQVIAKSTRLLVLIEGRDAAGKDGVIKRMTKHMSPRETLVWAPNVPTERDRRSWYFQRYVEHLPAGGEIVIFNRSWYNRAGVERVMGFCSSVELDEFFETVQSFEAMLVRAEIVLVKYYLDISKKEQKKRLAERRKDPLKQWKISPIDEKAHKLWDEYTEARDDMFLRTHSLIAPWIVVNADDQRVARLNVIRDLLGRVKYKGRDKKLAFAEPGLVFPFDKEALTDGRLAR